MRTRQAFPPIGALIKIRDVLSPTNIIIDVRASHKTRLLEQLSTQAAAKSGLAADEVAREIAKREELGSTGVGNGVELPHARLRGLKAPFGLLARPREGIRVRLSPGRHLPPMLPRLRFGFDPGAGAIRTSRRSPS
jgi:nitrogen PTS system EIIA component